jgi:hypothetical protein
MNLRRAAPAFILTVMAGYACTEQPTTPITRHSSAITTQVAAPPGTGLVLNSVTGLSLPLIGKLGNVTISQAEITNFAVVEALGQIVGVKAEGVLQLTGGVLGSQVISQDFSTMVSVISSGPGQCGVVTLDLAPIDINLLVAQVDVPAATVDAKASGALGPLLCALGQVLTPITQAVRGIVQAIDRLL